jgi:hypothetical protein
LESFPYRVVTSFRRSGRLAPDPASTRFFAPSTTSLERAPSAAGTSRSRSGSALRVLSPSQRVPGTSELRGLVSCRCRPWGSPFRALILAGIACASRRRMLPCSSPPPYLRCDACDLILRVSPTPALVARWPGHPPELGHRFHRPAPHALAHGPAATSPTSWIPRTGVTSFRWLRLLRSFSPPASPRTERAAFADAPRPMLSWASPLQSFDPVEPRTLS